MQKHQIKNGNIVLFSASASTCPPSSTTTMSRRGWPWRPWTNRKRNKKESRSQHSSYRQKNSSLPKSKKTIYITWNSSSLLTIRYHSQLVGRAYLQKIWFLCSVISHIFINKESTLEYLNDVHRQLNISKYHVFGLRDHKRKWRWSQLLNEILKAS